MPIIGIYCIYWEQEDTLCYIGQSIDIERRRTSHISNMKSNTHHNFKVQLMYNKYGVEGMVHSILEECTLDRLDEHEISWISEFDSFNNGLNLSTGGEGTGIGAEHPRALHSHSTYIEALTQLANTSNSIRSIAISLGMSEQTVGHIAKGDTHTYLGVSHPDIYYKMLAKLGYREGSKIGPISGKGYPSVKSPEGVIYDITNASVFATGMQLGKTSFSNLLHGKIKSYRGWTLANGVNVVYTPPLLKVYPKVRSPDGNIIIVTNPTSFALANSLHKGNFSSLINGNRKKCQGWTLA